MEVDGVVGDGDDILVLLVCQPCGEVLLFEHVATDEAVGFAHAQERADPGEFPAVETVAGLQQVPVAAPALPAPTTHISQVRVCMGIQR